MAVRRQRTVRRKCPLWVEKPPQHYAGKNVRFNISIAQSSRFGIGPPKSRLLGAHVGRPRSLLTFPKADSHVVRLCRSVWMG